MFSTSVEVFWNSAQRWLEEYLPRYVHVFSWLWQRALAHPAEAVSSLVYLTASPPTYPSHKTPQFLGN